MKTRRSNDQVGNVKVMTTTTPQRKKSKQNSTAVVRLERIPGMDKNVSATSSTSKNVKASSVESENNCFLCGNTPLTYLPQGRRHYIKQVELFKDYLMAMIDDSMSTLKDGKDNVETCTNCVKEIKKVWDLNQELEAIRQDIQKIVERVAATLTKTRARDLIASGDKPSLRTRRKYKSEKSNSKRQPKNKSKEPFSNTSSPDKLDFKQSDNEGNFDSGRDSRPELNSMLRVEFKQDVSWDENEDNNTPPNNAQYFEIMVVDPKINPQSESEQDFPGQLNPESELPSSYLPSNSMRPKRKSRLRAEELLQDVISSDDTDNKDAEFAISLLKRDTKPCGLNKLRLGKESSEKCEICQKLFSSSAVLRRHKILAHKLLPKSGCNECSRKFFNEVELQAHVELVHNPDTKLKSEGGDFCCSACGKKLSSRRNVAIHEVIICGVVWNEIELAKIGLQLLACEEEGCGKKFAKMAEFKRHTRTHSSIKPFSCPTCSKSFKHKFSLNLHLSTLCASPTSDPVISKAIRTRRSVNAKKPKPHRCKFCPKRFITSHMMKIHQERNHTSAEDARAICELCGASMSSAHLRHHIRRVHERAYSNFCPVLECGKAFFSSTELKEHTLRYHTPGHGGTGIGMRYTEKTLKCSHCPQLFRHPSTLSKHRARVHLTAEPKYACDSCEFKFYSKPDLVRHMKIHSRPGVDCTQCGRHFQHEFRLKMHYERDLCGKRVKNNGEAAKKKRIGWCGICQKIVGENKWLLSRHMRQLHPEMEGAVVAISGTGEESQAGAEVDNQNSEIVIQESGEGQIIFVVPDLQDEVEVGDSSTDNSAHIAVQSITQHEEGGGFH